MNADGTKKQHLVTFDFNLFEELFLSGYGIDWGTDGKNIAYIEYKEPDIMAIWVMNIETTKAGVPLWNSDGTRIAYTSIIYTLIPREYYGEYNIGDIWMMTLGEIEPTPTPTLPTSTTIPSPTLTMTSIHEEEKRR